MHSDQDSDQDSDQESSNDEQENSTANILRELKSVQPKPSSQFSSPIILLPEKPLTNSNLNRLTLNNIYIHLQADLTENPQLKNKNRLSNEEINHLAASILKKMGYEASNELNSLAMDLNKKLRQQKMKLSDMLNFDTQEAFALKCVYQGLRPNDEIRLKKINLSSSSQSVSHEQSQILQNR